MLGNGLPVQTSGVGVGLTSEVDSGVELGSGLDVGSGVGLDVGSGDVVGDSDGVGEVSGVVTGASGAGDSETAGEEVCSVSPHLPAVVMV